MLVKFINSITKSGTKRFTPLATARSAPNAGRKGNEMPRKRKSVSESLYEPKKVKLTELRNNSESNENFPLYNVDNLASTTGIKVSFSTGSVRKPKPPVHPATSTPFEIIDIRGNIRKCSGCKSDLKSGPLDAVSSELDEKVCLRRKEVDCVWIEQRRD